MTDAYPVTDRAGDPDERPDPDSDDGMAYAVDPRAGEGRATADGAGWGSEP